MNEQELRERFATAEVPPSRLGVDSVLRAGRRRVARRRSGQAAVGVALAVTVLVGVPSVLTRNRAQPPEKPVLPVAPATPVACQASKLPAPAGVVGVTVEGVDPTGRYVVGNGTVGQDFRPIRWADGKAEAMPVGGSASRQATAVNAEGVVVGLISDGKTSEVFRYENGGYTALQLPEGDMHPFPEPAINAGGDVVINVKPKGGGDSYAVVWESGSPSSTRLPLPEGAQVHDITDDGTVVGAMYEDGQAVAGYAWDQQGNGRKLEVPDGQTAAAYAAQDDVAVGGLWPDEAATRWDIRTGRLITRVVDREALGPATATNADGWIVGEGAVHRGSERLVLPVPKGGTASAQAVSDTGLVAGHVTGKDGKNLGPYVWQC